jgi:hypothetical protein
MTRKSLLSYPRDPLVPEPVKGMWSMTNVQQLLPTRRVTIRSSKIFCKRSTQL